MISERYEEIEKYGKSARGRAELLKYINGGKITPGQAIKSKCYDCCGYYADGKIDCKVKLCPLYPFMPFRKKEEKAAPKMSLEKRENFRLSMLEHREAKANLKEIMKTNTTIPVKGKKKENTLK